MLRIMQGSCRLSLSLSERGVEYMTYQYRVTDESDGVWCDGSQQSWNYQKKTKDTQKLFGDVRKKNRVITDDYLSYLNLKVMVEPCKRKTGFFEKTIGYIPCYEASTMTDGYIRIIQLSRKKITAVLLMFLIILAGGMFGFYRMVAPADDNPIKIASGELSNPDPKNIRLPGIERIYAEAGSTRVKQLLLNVEGNGYNLQYTIILEETGEVLYKSKIIQPGYGVREFDMTRTFEEGVYPILVNVNSSAQEESDSNGNTAFNAGQLEAELIVE